MCAELCTERKHCCPDPSEGTTALTPVLRPITAPYPLHPQ